MKSRLILLFLLGAGLRASAAEAAPPVVAAPAKAGVTSRPAAPTTPAGATFESFRIVGELNIFNPYRTGRTRRGEAAVPQGDIISLVGTLQDRGRSLAFFDGTDNAWRKTLPAGEKVGDFTIKQVLANTVDVERNGKTTTVRVGQQLRRPVGGDWGLVGAETIYAEAQAARAAVSAAAKPDPSAPGAIPADASDVVRRMMEQRNKNLKQ
jgi:hypothetical protein